jgi:hypothetical protein
VRSCNPAFQLINWTDKDCGSTFYEVKYDNKCNCKGAKSLFSIVTKKRGTLDLPSSYRAATGQYLSPPQTSEKSELLIAA